MALLVDGHIKATFAAGAVPVTVEDLHLSKLGLQIVNVSTSVTLRWSRPTRTLLLHYNSHSVAFRARAKLIGARLMNNTVNCALDEASDDGGFTLRIFNLPWRISEDKIVDRLPAALRPEKKDIAVLKVTQKPNSSVIRAVVNRLPKFNPICIKEYPDDFSPTVKLWFASQRLDGIARMLDGRRLPQFCGSRIDAMETMKVQLILDAAIYQRNRGLLKSCSHSVRRRPWCNVHFDEENHVPGAPIQVVIEGADREALMVAKTALEKLLIHNTIGRLSPPPKPSSQTHRIVLTKTTDYVNATDGGGLRQAQKALGKPTVYLETFSSPPVIVVRGDTCTLRRVQRHLSPDGSLPPGKQRFCEVCWDESDDIIKVQGCQHIACKDCFVQYCTLNRDDKFPLQCFQTECKTLLSMDEVRLALGEDNFQRLTSDAIETHFRQETARYIKCPGPDCTSYFKNESETHVCPSCFTMACCSCKVEYHFGESCELYKERMAGNEEKFRKWMEQEGAKQCPRCKGAVQKEVGCNHMTCGWCEQHFCFTCLKMFDKEEAVYKHMGEEHGGFYANDREAREANEDAIRQALDDVDWLAAGAP